MLARPKFASAMSDEDRITVIALITDAAVWVEPTFRITDCRDAKDNKYLELAVAAGAKIMSPATTTSSFCIPGARYGSYARQNTSRTGR